MIRTYCTHFRGSRLAFPLMRCDGYVKRHFVDYSGNPQIELFVDLSKGFDENHGRDTISLCLVSPPLKIQSKLLTIYNFSATGENRITICHFIDGASGHFFYSGNFLHYSAPSSFFGDIRSSLFSRTANI